MWGHYGWDQRSLVKLGLGQVHSGHCSGVGSVWCPALLRDVDWGAYMLLQNVEMPVLMPVFEESTFSGLFVIICNKYVVIRGKLWFICSATKYKLSSFPRLTAYLLLPKWGRISFQYGTGLGAVC